MGAQFVPAIQAQLNGKSYSTQFIADNMVEVRVPGILPVGQYDLMLKRPDNAQATFPAAFQVISGQDLYANTPSLWSDPRTLRQGEPTDIGLTLYRMADAGSPPLANVEVRFFRGNPAAGGQLLGAAAASNLAAGGWADTAGVAWTPPGAGDVTLYAVIDPNNTIEEATKANNVISRTVTVQASVVDKTPPTISRFVVNDRTIATVGSANVTLSISASDPVVTAAGLDAESGVSTILVREYRWEDGAQAWLETRSANASYSGAALNFKWILAGATGRKLIRAWAVDGAGNTSAPADIYLILNSAWAPESLWHTYLLPAQAGQSLSISIGQLGGHPQDPDLYVWPPNYPDDTRSWSSVLYPPGSPFTPAGARDAVSFVAPETGSYRIGVYGWTSAQYDIAVDVTGVANIEQGVGVVTGADVAVEEKPLQATPPLIEEAAPSANEAPPDLPRASGTSVFLPLITR